MSSSESHTSQVSDEQAIYRADDVPASIKSSVTPSEEYIYTYIAIPPDGGWGWIIVVASFLCNFIVDGAVYTFGIFLPDISASYNTLATNIAIANSLMSGFCLFSGPIACAIVNRIGFQLTGIVGGVIAAFAFILSTLTTTVAGFLIVLGFVGGFGSGFIYVPSIIVIGFYFERWRALATSVAVTGSACGIMFFPLLINSLSGFNWQTKFQIIGGLCFLAATLALFYKPLKLTHVLTTKDRKIVQLLSDDGSPSIYTLNNDKKGGFLTKIYSKLHGSKPSNTTFQSYRDSTLLMYFPTGPSVSSVFIGTVNEENFGMTPSRMIEGRSEKCDKLSTVYEDEDAKNEKCCRKCNCKCCNWCCTKIVNQNRPMNRDDIFYTGSIYTLPEYSQSKPSQMTNKAKSIDYTMSVTRFDFYEDKTKQKSSCEQCYESIIKTLTEMLKIDLLKRPSFLLLAISGFFTTVGMYIPFIYLIERASELQIDKSVSYYFYTALGASNAVGRICCGIISSLPNAKPLMITYISLFICGASTVGSYFFIGIPMHFLFATTYGLTIACFPSLKTPIVVELFGLENLTSAFGWLLLFNSAAAFAGIPLAGKIVKLTGSFNKSFLFSGISITLSSILLIPVKQITNYEKRKA